MTEIRAGRGAWAEPAVDEVSPGVFRIPLPLPDDGLRAVNVYVLVGADAVVAIDSGWAIPEARALLLSGLETLGLGAGDIRRFLVTHMHRDHYTQAVALRRDFGNTVALGAGERPALEYAIGSSWEPFGPQLTALRVLGAEKLVAEIRAMVSDVEDPVREYDVELPDQWLVGGSLTTESGRTLEVVETPGHTRGHVVFHDLAAGLLFAGDHVLPQITPSIGFEPIASPNPLGDFLASLALVRSRPDAVLLPAHGPVAPSVHARVDELVDHHGRRLDATEAAVLAGATTGLEVAGQLTWTRREHALADLDPFNAMLAVTETGAHLQLLLAQGRLRVEEAEGVRHYLPG